MDILGLDPGLRKTGWGIIRLESGGLIKHIANGIIKPPTDKSLGERLAFLHGEINKIIAEFKPHTAAVEETFVNKNPKSTLLLGQARGVAVMTVAHNHVHLEEYSANKVKKTVVGAGHAGKEQMLAMINILLPNTDIAGEDAADALAIAICHSQHHILWADKLC